MNRSITIKEFTKYLENCSLEELKGIASKIDPYMFPKRYQLVNEKLSILQSTSQSNKKRIPSKNERTKTTKDISTGPFKNLNPPKWPFNDIICGISLPVFIIIYNMLAEYLRPSFSPVFGFIFFISIFILSIAIMLIYPIYACKKRQFWPLISFTNIRNILNEIGTSFLYWLLIGIILGLTLATTKAIFNMPDQESLMIKFISNIPNTTLLVIIIIYISILGPIIEEIFFRGFLYNSMKTHFPVWVAIIFQAVFFSFIHDPYDLMHIFSTFLMGVAFAWAYELRGTLLSPIFIHIIANIMWSLRAIMAR